MQAKVKQDREAKRELVEEFKFRKEMEKQKDRQYDDFTKKKERE